MRVNFIVRSFAILGVVSLLTVSYQNCAGNVVINPLDQASAGNSCWNTGSGGLTETCGVNVGIGTSSPAELLDVEGGNVKMGWTAMPVAAISGSLGAGAWTGFFDYCGNGAYPISLSCWGATAVLCPWQVNSAGQLSVYNCSGVTSVLYCSGICANMR